ncbi:MAG: MucR family transcriptional regulator [Acetobacteraceae bacterium]
MAEVPVNPTLLDLTARIVAAHVAANPLPAEALPKLIQSVHETLAALGGAPAAAERPAPAVPPRKSVFSDYIICLEDGKKLKMLRRHLKTAYNMTPEQYRERWGLTPDYPMVAPGYSERRSSLARQSGLGTRSRAPAA